MITSKQTPHSTVTETSEQVAVPTKQRAQSQTYLVWITLRKNKGALIGGVLLLLIVLTIVLAPLFTAYDPLSQSSDPADRLSAPSLEHPMGTDELRRDVLARVLYGGRITIRVSVISIFSAVLIGSVTGIVAGFYGGRIDDIISRVIDVLMTLPAILLAIVVVAILGPSLENAMVAVALVNIPIFARLTRGSTLSEKNNTYVEASRSLGASDRHLMIRHILPNVLAPVIVIGSLSIANAIQVVAGLSFLGLGAQPPDPEWGSMLSNGRNYMRSGEWWMTVFPGLAIFITVLSINLLGDGLRDALDPRLRNR